MKKLRFLLGVSAAATAAVALLLSTGLLGQAADTLPSSLSNREFWELSQKLSEPDGFFRSNSGSPDNLLSNESGISAMAAIVSERVRGPGVYLGVGPEQNFTYIVAMRARIAFITDIRRGNLHVHLLYKALFETSKDRVEFVGRLFSRQPPADLTPTASAAHLLNAYLGARPVDDKTFKSNLASVNTHLTKTRGLPLSADDLAGIEYVYATYHRFGPAIDYVSSIRNTSGSSGSYARILSATDPMGVERTYLANEENFAFVKSLQIRNLIVPVVGDFAGPTALRAIGAYIRQRGASVGAFYVSNVEQYLQRNGVWGRFCANVASLPLTPGSVFIRPSGRVGTLGAIAEETAQCRN